MVYVAGLRHDDQSDEGFWRLYVNSINISTEVSSQGWGLRGYRLAGGEVMIELKPENQRTVPDRGPKNK